MEELITDSNSDIQSRFYFRIIGDTIDIMYRPSHDYYGFVPNNEDGLNEIRELIGYDRETFKLMLAANVMCRGAKPIGKFDDNIVKLEEWYKKAWYSHTEQLVKKYNLEIPIEQVIMNEELKELRQ